VFIDVDEITGVVDWSEAGQGDALYDLASLTLGHEEHLGDVAAGYGTDVDLDVMIRAWWSLRSLERSGGWSSTASTRPRQAASWTC
jgi:aminoglycoside phosphotransferase (APT) family kinase protein